ncbi:trans-sulfuration enzyme family protein [Boseongicola aestuarii]|uniref:Cystathionine beta-lyase MetC n=1 Tax=Boseongicola aestuarii TaxID=1470561 RepID=A0A238IV54_9RHOB|nr:PLP-dependent transferase [Boseongicola aestuarii]SMX22206.1 Cystathionine beta-lyase MetC [Boseongicola aestuarii]
MSDTPSKPFRTPWPGSVSRPVVNPLQPSVVYASDDPDALDAQYEGGAKGFTYAREGHPNAEVLGQMVDAMEGAKGGVVTGSGMGAVTVALLGTVRAGDHVLGADQLYGRSLRLMNEELPRLGIATSLADPTDVAAFEAAIRPETRLILIETVSNPTLRVADVDGIIAMALARGVLVAVDNTFPTPRGCQPLARGADIVIHSVTKLMAGHSDATLGYVAARDPDLAARFLTLAVSMGFTASPFDCWLAERGLYSFDLRYERCTATAARLGDALADMPGVERVLYPARSDHPDHNRSISLLGGEGGHMVSFEIAGGRAGANAFVRAAEGLNFAPTLGDIATTISHPATSSHRALTPEARAALGISEGFFRISVGCEPADALIATFDTAVRAACEV